jgi:hypothetical protein
MYLRLFCPSSIKLVNIDYVDLTQEYLITNYV